MLAVCCQRHLSPWDGFVDYAMQEVLCLSVFVKYSCMTPCCSMALPVDLNILRTAAQAMAEASPPVENPRRHAGILC
jgi:hypothetical protein